VIIDYLVGWGVVSWTSVMFFSDGTDFFYFWALVIIIFFRKAQMSIHLSFLFYVSWSGSLGHPWHPSYHQHCPSLPGGAQSIPMPDEIYYHSSVLGLPWVLFPPRGRRPGGCWSDPTWRSRSSNWSSFWMSELLHLPRVQTPDDGRAHVERPCYLLLLLNFLIIRLWSWESSMPP